MPMRSGLHEHELPVGRRKRRRKKADAEDRRAQDEREHDAEPIGDPPHQHAAGREADHGRGERKRGAAPADGEFGLDRRQDDDGRPQADAADRAQRERRRQPPPGIAAVGSPRPLRRDRHGQSNVFWMNVDSNCLCRRVVGSCIRLPGSRLI